MCDAPDKPARTTGVYAKLTKLLVVYIYRQALLAYREVLSE